ncbi:MAG: 23S rRNA (pseudouridine(1915)-N(3))-methyltransferase RlmH [Desulfocapsaceae bacterium]|nr:23S rRNA (pseudouridine(1915)-N(3))-methyltransferase RlmH [Desulfocapsaceae bacterium]
MKIEVLFLGKTKDAYLAEGINGYIARLSHYVSLSVKTVKMKAKAQWNDEIIKEQEGKLLLNHVPAGAFKVVLDSRGRQCTSEELAALLDRWEQRGEKQISFLIGGALGVSQEVETGADLLLSFSKMTFTHDMIRLFLLEQLYRAYTIKAGEKYHK